MTLQYISRISKPKLHHISIDLRLSQNISIYLSIYLEYFCYFNTFQDISTYFITQRTPHSNSPEDAAKYLNISEIFPIFLAFQFRDISIYFTHFNIQRTPHFNSPEAIAKYYNISGISILS